MATQSTNTPSPTDENPQNPGPMIEKPMEVNSQESQDSKGGAANDSFRIAISASSEPMREEQVQNAVKFLQHPKVRGSPVIYRRSFLEKKGLTREEIDEAFRRVPDPPSNATNVEAATQESQLKPSTSFQPQVSTLTPQPTAAPKAIVSMEPALQQSRFHWSHAFLAIGVLAASGAGTAVLLKNAVVPRLKAWIRKVVKEVDDTENKDNSKRSPSEEAAKAAASAAALVAKASQELLNARNEEKKYFEAFKGLLDVQVEEMKSMGNTIRKLEGSREVPLSLDKQIEEHIQSTSANGPISRRIPHVNQSDPRLSSMFFKQGEVNGTPDVDFGAVRSSIAPAFVDSTATPYSKPSMEPRESNYGPQYQVRGDGSVVGVRDNQYSHQLNGKSSGGSYPWWKNMKITEIEPEVGAPKVPSNGIGSNEWPGRGWVPPQTPMVAVPEAAAAIRQPKPSILKQQVGNEQSMIQPGDRDDGTVGASYPAIETPSSGGAATNLTQTEIQEEQLGEAR